MLRPDDPTDDESSRAATESLGLRIQQHRKARRLTLVALAEMSGLSQPFLSQIERGRARPSMESLHRIARALETTTPVLMSTSAGPGQSDDASPEIDESAVSLVRADQGAVLAHSNGRARALVSGSRAMYPLRFHVEETEFEDYYEHAGDEFIHVLSGSVDVDLEGRGIFELHEADTLYYAGGTRHRWRVHGIWPAQLLVVQSAPAAADSLPDGAERHL